MTEPGLLAYDPARIQALADATAAAVRFLRGVRSDEPFAAAAIEVVSSIAFRLETEWLPMLVRLGADTSMIEWDSDGPATSGTPTAAASPSGFRAPRNGTAPAVDIPELLALVEAIMHGDEAAITALDQLLAGASPAQVTAFVAELGPEGYALLMIVLVHSPGLTEAPDPDTDEMARRSLARTLAAGATAFDPAELVASAVAVLADPPTDSRPGEAEYAVAIVLSGARPEAQAAFVAAAVAYEQETGNQLGYDPTHLSHPPEDHSPVQVELVAPTRDPVAFALTELADDPAVARGLLSDGGVHTYLLFEREWSDGYTGIVVASAAAAAGDDLTDPALPPSAGTVQQANEIASRTVSQLGARGVTADDVSAEASEAAGQIVGVHAAAADATVTVTGVDGSSPVVLSSDEVLSGAVASYTDPALGEIEIAVFGSYELGNFIGIAASTDEGLAVMTWGVGAFQQARIDAGVTLVADGTWDSDRFAAMQHQAANLEGFLYQQIGWQAQQAGRDADAAQNLFVRVLLVGGRAVGTWGSTSAGVPWVTGFYGYPETAILTAVAGDHEAQAVAEATTNARQASSLLNERILRSLDAAGVIDVVLPPVDEFLSLTGERQIEVGGDMMTSAVEDSDTFVFNPLATTEHFATVQLDAFNELPDGWDPPTAGSWRAQP